MIQAWSWYEASFLHPVLIHKLRRKGHSDSSQSVLNSISRLFFFFSPSYLEMQIGYNLFRISELHFILRSEFFFVYLPEARLSNKMDQLLLLLVFKYSYPLLFWLLCVLFKSPFKGRKLICYVCIICRSVNGLACSSANFLGQ